MNQHYKTLTDRELLEKTYIAAEKTRQYFLWMMIGSVVVFILPLIGLVFVIPMLLNSFGQLNALGI